MSLGHQPCHFQNPPHIDDLSFERPHVFLLGAGASVAAFPDGEKNGRRLPTMVDFVETVDIGMEFSRAGIAWEGRNFEVLYAELSSDERYADLRAAIDRKVRSYFERLELPDDPTLYDHLVLSLRSKDVIASFNWDPFLFDACARNAGRSDLPETFFLHGNVRVGYGGDHRKAGPLLSTCPDCGGAFKPSRLLFPITKKNYTCDPYTSAQWQHLRIALKNAYMLTVFGYSAPNSDVEAMELMQEAWGPPMSRNLEETEIIDIKSKECLSKTWQGFIHTHHYRIARDFYDSWTTSYPRRSCEALWATVMRNNPRRPAKFPKDDTFQALFDWLKPLLTAESLKSRS